MAKNEGPDITARGTIANMGGVTAWTPNGVAHDTQGRADTETAANVETCTGIERFKGARSGKPSPQSSWGGNRSGE